MIWQTSPDKFLAIIRPKNALDIFKSVNPSLNSMMLVRDADGLVVGKKEIHVKALLTILISETLNFFSVGNSMNSPQLAQTINLILDEYSLYKIDFFVYTFNNAKKGFYGTTFNRIDGQIIFEWLSKADIDYSIAVEQERVNEMKRLNRKDIGVPDPITSKALDELVDEKDRPIPMPEYVKETIKNIGSKIIMTNKETPFSEEQKRINELVKDFDVIFDEQDNGKGGKRFINFDHRMMDVTEYMEYRIKFDQ